MKKIWIDPGHGGKDPGAVGCNRRECDDSLLYALELDRQFREQGFETVMTRKEDCYKTYDERTAIERKGKCDLAISCHRNGFTSEATGFEIWIHSTAPDSFVAWAQETCDGVEELGLEPHGGVGVKKGFPGFPKDNYYANSGTISPSMLIEFGYMQNPKDTAFFAAHYAEVCTVIVKASCRFLGVTYKTPIEVDDGGSAGLKKRIVELEQLLTEAQDARIIYEQKVKNVIDILAAQ